MARADPFLCSFILSKWATRIQLTLLLAFVTLVTMDQFSRLFMDFRTGVRTKDYALSQGADRRRGQDDCYSMPRANSRARVASPAFCKATAITMRICCSAAIASSSPGWE